MAHTPTILQDKKGERTITSYYIPYHGHDVRHLAIALRALREKHDSVGGNDVALAPTVCTAVNLGVLTRCTPGWCFGDEGGDTRYESANSKNKAWCPLVCVPNVYAFGDCGRVCCGVPGCVAGVASCPVGFGYVTDLFGNRVENYVNRLVSKTIKEQQRGEEIWKQLGGKMDVFESG